MTAWDRPWFRAKRQPPPSTFDLPATISGELTAIAQHRISPGERVAVLVGSRGISRLGEVVAGVVGVLQARGATVVLVPAMGSHGGATPDGQVAILEEHGVDWRTLGVTVDASMEVEKVGRLSCGTPVYTACGGLRCDAVIPINRVKPHTDFRAPIESGLTKMLTIGLGKVIGASSLHARGFDKFHDILPEAAQLLLDRLRVPFGVALVEDAWHRLAYLEAVPGETLLERDEVLLAKAWDNLGVLPFSEVDLLILRELGKDISGAGIDPNVSGRWAQRDLGGPTKVAGLVILDLSGRSAGNASGVGMADVVTERLRSKIDWPVTYRNALASRVLASAKLPLVAGTDREAVELATSCSIGVELNHARMVAMHNTLSVHDLAISEELVPAALAAGYKVDPTAQLARFDGAGGLLSVAGLAFFESTE